ncbi:MAG: TIGR00730 family Rossman fold protein [Pirellulales bacterium]|nr:TIGR00730 family Rossman fold protein [Pirellulales bacterium]
MSQKPTGKPRPAAAGSPAEGDDAPLGESTLDLARRVEQNREAILASPTYRLAEIDIDFLGRSEQRPVRMQLELLKTETLLRENKISTTIVVFGGTQIVPREEAEARLARTRLHLKDAPDDARRRREVARAESVLAKSHYYDEAREFARIVSSVCQTNGKCDFVVTTGGGPGVMEAANRGAFDVGAKSVGFNIELPHEQEPNPYITPELCFQFHYFAMRKFHFLLRAAALVVFPGGFGTFDELFDTLTLRQTGRMQEIPIILYGHDYWNRMINFQALADEGVIADEHLDLLHYADTPQEAWEIIAEFHGVK